MSEPEKPERVPSDEELVAELAANQRKSRVVWTAVFLSAVVFLVAAIWLAAENRELLFAPKPDMSEVERLAFERSNDPACRQMVETLDARQQGWSQLRVELKELHASTDRAAIEKGRASIVELMETYRLEQRRLEIAVIQDRDAETAEGRWHKTDLRGDIQRYFKHILHFLGKMEAALTERLAELDGKVTGEPLVVAGLGEVGRKDGEKAATAGERYQTAWSRVTEDHDKWRIFRQGPSPCGRREGAVPELPPERTGSALEALKRDYGMVDAPSADAGGADASAVAPSADGGGAGASDAAPEVQAPPSGAGEAPASPDAAADAAP